MPTLARISNTFFTGLLNRLGIRPPFVEGWEITNLVQPVSLVDSDVAITAIATTQVLEVPASAGIVAPALNQLLANVGPATESREYSAFVVFSFGSTAAPDVVLERVTSGGATIWSQLLTVPVAGTIFWPMRLKLQAGDYLRVRKVTAADPSGRYQASIWLS
jgi:hypothetical protein